MTIERSIRERVAEKLGHDPVLVGRVIEEFCLELRKGIDGYKGLNGDYIGEQLHWEISTRAFFHFLGFLDEFSGRYEWEPGIATEYIARLYSRDDLEPFSNEYRTPQGGTETQAPSVLGELIERFSAAASSCAMTLISNAGYIQTELSNVELPEEYRIRVETLCNDWIGIKHDVLNELDELADQPNVGGRVRNIMSWLGEEVVKLQNQVSELEKLANADKRYMLAYLLVGESGGNFLRSFVTVGDAANRFLAELN